jgi:hypothetical protein
LGQVPQLKVPPQPSVGLPHCPAAHVFLGHAEHSWSMHVGVAPLHVPQCIVP